MYGVEPNLEALPELRKQLVRNGIVEKYEILGFGVEETDKMNEAGVFPGSIDTIVCVLAQIPLVSHSTSVFYLLLALAVFSNTFPCSSNLSLPSFLLSSAFLLFP